jgi:biopolymer transport protein ExbD
MAPRLSGSRDKFDLGQQFRINVTPLVGVMLLLLIFFMIAARPPAAMEIDNSISDWFGPTPSIPSAFINIERDHKLYIGARPTTLETLVIDVGAAIGDPRPANYHVSVRAGRDVPYGDFVAVMSALKEAGYQPGLIREDL